MNVLPETSTHLQTQCEKLGSEKVLCQYCFTFKVLFIFYHFFKSYQRQAFSQDDVLAFSLDDIDFLTAAGE